MNKSENFELIFEGVRNNCPLARQRLQALLSRQSISRIFEIDSVIDSGPLLLQRSADKQALEISYRELKKAGAQVLLVRAQADTPNISRRRATLSLVPPADTANGQARAVFQSFHETFQNYTAQLNRVLAAVNLAEVEALARDLLAVRDRRRQIFVFGSESCLLPSAQFVRALLALQSEDEHYLFRVTGLHDNCRAGLKGGDTVDPDLAYLNQLKRFLRPGDLTLALCAEGDADALLRATEYADRRGAKTWAIIGGNGGRLKQASRRTVAVPPVCGASHCMEDVVIILARIVAAFIDQRDRILGRS
jgi:D-sedoheptulose 7-phosphate isomerase